MSKKITLSLLFIVILITIFISFTEYNVSQGEENKGVLEADIEQSLKEGLWAYYDGKIDQAISLYLDVIATDDNNLTALKNLSSILEENGDIKESLDFNQQIISLEPDNLYWKFDYGIKLLKNGLYQESNQILLEIYEYVNTNQNSQLSIKQEAMLFYYLAYISYHLKQEGIAEDYLLLGIERDPYLTLNYLLLAELYDRQKKEQLAIKYYKEALSKDSSQTDIYPRLARIYQMLSEEGDAYYYWNKSLATRNKEEYAKAQIALLEKEHPQLLRENAQKKEEARRDIKWVEVKPIVESNNIPMVRVGLINKARSLNFQTGANFRIYQKNDNSLLVSGLPDEEWEIKSTAKGYEFYRENNLEKVVVGHQALSIKLKDETASFVLYDISYGQGYFWAGNEDRQYRGELEVFPIDHVFNVINIINLEEYLFSVLPSEMPAWWPEEALKVQAVVARSYAIAHLTRHQSQGYNLCSTVHCAAYNGVKSEHARTNQAVLATIGQVGYYQDRVIDAVFSSNSGGHTETVKEVWGYDIPYLTGVSTLLKDELSFPLEPYQIKQWLLEEPDSYSNFTRYAGHNKYRWVKHLSVDYLQEKYNMKIVLDLKTVGRTTGGGVEEVIIEGKDKELSVSGDRIRGALGGLKSNRFVMDKIYNQEGSIIDIIFTGSGWGHNVGMDQTGAAGMANEGYNYSEILQHFYQDVEIKNYYKP